MSIVLAVVTYLLAGSCLCHENDAVSVPDEFIVRRLLGANEFKEGRHTLIGFGARAFPTYLGMLAAKDIDPRDVAGIFGVLKDVEADRSVFLEHAANGLGHSATLVRLTAVGFLGRIGHERDVAPVVALLSDERREVSYAAATTLAAIGGQRSLIAFDVWLRSGSHRDDVELRRHAAKCRDDLRQRLEKGRKPH